MIESQQLNSSIVSDATVASLISVSGRVQGVGFRPFVYRLALSCCLNGWVRNELGTVQIHVEGRQSDIEHFCQQLIESKPAIALPDIHSIQPASVSGYTQFEILQSADLGTPQISVPSDLFLCDECLSELYDSANRRYRYPFINCTQCGPRYTIIQSLPYDRHHTTMAHFTLCSACEAEYTDPANRRFHAEPVACAECGPSISLKYDQIIYKHEQALSQAIELIRQGKIIAIKGIGGYHLVCDATNVDAVARLRQRKQRPDKPFAVMFPAPMHNPLDILQQYFELDRTTTELLLDPSRPIVLVAQQLSAEKILAENIAPGLQEIGAMLPYSPLHHLLLNDLNMPMLATSANLSGEPVLIDNTEVEQRLDSVADAYLHHNRPVQRPADDSVYRIINKQPRPIRYGRGVTPLELSLPFTLDKPVIAVGGHMKDSVCLAWSNRLVMSSHIGEMHMLRSLRVFEQTMTDLQHLYDVKAAVYICDQHPAYTTHQWVNKQCLDSCKVFHHHAHASACYYEAGVEQNMMVFTWDGTGYGEDDTLWGGEALYGRPGRWQRKATLKAFDLPGGDKVALQPWRTAVSICRHLDTAFTCNHADENLLKHALDKQLNCTPSSSMGRLFDAASVFCGQAQVCSFDGQAPMQLEALCHGLSTNLAEYVDCPMEPEDDLLVADWRPLMTRLLQPGNAAQKSRLFHESMAQLLLKQALKIREHTACSQVGLSGGVFQNKVLTERVIQLLNAHQFTVCLPSTIPVNDAGISFGQVIEYAAMNKFKE